MKRALTLCFIFCSFSALLGCTTTQNDWGSYSNELYTYYKNPSQDEKQELVNELAEVFARVEKKGAIPAPGLYAEYGTFLFQEGDYQKAIIFFEKEKNAWPESAKFMDSLIQALSKQIKNTNAGEGE